MTPADQKRDYTQTREIIRQIRETIAWLEERIDQPGGASPLIRRAEIAGYRGILNDLEEQAAAYEVGNVPLGSAAG